MLRIKDEVKKMISDDGLVSVIMMISGENAVITSEKRERILEITGEPCIRLPRVRSPQWMSHVECISYDLGYTRGHGPDNHFSDTPFCRVTPFLHHWIKNPDQLYSTVFASDFTYMSSGHNWPDDHPLIVFAMFMWFLLVSLYSSVHW